MRMHEEYSFNPINIELTNLLDQLDLVWVHLPLRDPAQLGQHMPPHVTDTMQLAFFELEHLPFFKHSTVLGLEDLNHFSMIVSCSLLHGRRKP